MFRLLFARLFQPGPPIRRSRPTFCLRMEMLEVRELPAVMAWVGEASSYANDPANWCEMWTSPLVHRLPSSSDDLFFGQQGLMGPCQNLSGEFASITITENYVATITLGGTLTVGSFYMNSADGGPDGGFVAGEIDQAGNDIIVDGPSFEWYNGVINSGNTAATVKITGCGTMATIDASQAWATGYTLQTGSTVDFEDGVTALVTGGALLNKLNTSIVVGLNAVVTFQDIYLASATADAPPDRVSNGGVSTYKGGVTSDRALVVDVAGTAIIRGGGTVAFNGSDGYGSVTMNAGANALVVENGTTLAASNDFEMRGGKLATMATDSENQAPAVIDTSRSTIFRGDITISDTAYNPEGVTDHRFGQLRFTGAIVWSGGTYRPVVDGSDGTGAADLWFAEGSFSVGSGARLAPGAVNIPEGASGPVLGMWLVLHSELRVDWTFGTIFDPPDSGWRLSRAGGDKDWYVTWLDPNS